MKSHAKENPYPCALCGKKFISKNHPMRLIEIINVKNPYPCAECVKGLTKIGMKSLSRENPYPGLFLS